MMKFFKVRRRKANDKIFDNSYNRGEIDYQKFESVEIDRGYSIDRMNEFNESFAYYQNKILFRQMRVLFRKSEWSSYIKKNKKIPKQEVAQIYDTFYRKIKNESISDCEFFVCVADFMNINYKTMYNLVPYVYKANILSELDEKFGVIKKQKINKLF